jgi:ubiquinone/menaquinone biosynthesis C-methylase UbiE
MNWGWRYDLFVWLADKLLLRGKLKELRYRNLEVAQLQKGEAVLDVGCGTGTLALLAKERVGATGRVYGIDPGTEQLARARAKAARRNSSIEFQPGVIEKLAVPDQSFEVVFSTLMLHHLPEDLKQQGLAEIVRVLKPGGRLVIADFKRPQNQKDSGRAAHFGAGESGFQEVPALMHQAGLVRIESGELSFPRFPGLAGAGFALGRKA